MSGTILILVAILVRYIKCEEEISVVGLFEPHEAHQHRHEISFLALGLLAWEHFLRSFEQRDRHFAGNLDIWHDCLGLNLVRKGLAVDDSGVFCALRLSQILEVVLNCFIVWLPGIFQNLDDELVTTVGGVVLVDV